MGSEAAAAERAKILGIFQPPPPPVLFLMTSSVLYCFHVFQSVFDWFVISIVVSLVYFRCVNEAKINKTESMVEQLLSHVYFYLILQ